MIVDDALIMRMKIKQIAISSGWNIACEATNGLEAVELYKQHQPDLVTLDLVMPELDGLGALKQIMEFDSQAKIVMVSAVDQKEKLEACIMGGAMDFIVKPFDVDRLRGFFDKYLNLE